MSDKFGFTRRPGELYEEWPKQPDGSPVPPKFLTHCASTDLSDQMLVSMLAAYGIPAVVEYPGDGAFGKVMLGLSGTGSSIYVPETLYIDAKELMEGENNDELPG
ncbi:MAG: hypothetical protein IJ705_07160 [Oscillospiraceae bacterium]|nr:hypothetical protein [Oscillospiraceae bacterium]